MLREECSSRDLLHDYEPSSGPSFQALIATAPPLVGVGVDAPGVVGAAVGEEQAAPRPGVDPAAGAGPRPAVAPGNAGVQRPAGRSQLQLGAAGGLGTSWGGGQLQQLVDARQAALQAVSRRQLHAQDEN